MSQLPLFFLSDTMHSDQVIWGPGRPAYTVTLHRLLMLVRCFDIDHCFDKLTTALDFVLGLLLFNPHTVSFAFLFVAINV